MEGSCWQGEDHVTMNQMVATIQAVKTTCCTQFQASWSHLRQATQRHSQENRETVNLCRHCRHPQSCFLKEKERARMQVFMLSSGTSVLTYVVQLTTFLLVTRQAACSVGTRLCLQSEQTGKQGTGAKMISGLHTYLSPKSIIAFNAEF